MFNPEQLLGQLLGGSMAGSLGGKRKKRKGGSMLGGMSAGTKAQLGIGLLGVAMAAYDHYKNRAPAATGPAGGFPPGPAPQAPMGGMNTVPPPPPGASPIASPAAAAVPVATDPRARDMVLLIQAMVAAAAADGHIDENERGQILQRAGDAGLDAQTQAFLRAELDAPKSLAAIVSMSRPEIAGDVYAASCVAVDADTDAERVYLDTLARRLALPESQRQQIHQQLGLA